MSYQRDIIAGLLASVGLIETGITYGYSSPALLSLQKEGILTSTSTGWFASLHLLGSVFGAFITGYLLNIYGRKNILLWCNLPSLIGWFLILSSQNSIQINIGRFLAGFAGAIRSQSISVYEVEIAVKSRRGALSSLLGLVGNFGIFLIYVFGVFLSWRWTADIAILVILISVLCILPLPDTPRWYLLNGKRNKAIDVLSWIYGTENVDQELMEIEASLQNSQDGSGWSTLLDQRLIKRIFLAVYIMSMNQLCGKFVIVAYQNKIFAEVGFSSPDLPSIIVAALSTASSILNTFAVDRLGRKPLYVIGGSLITLSLVLLGICFYIDTIATQWTAVVCFILYNLAYASSWGSVSMLVSAEMFPLKARGTGTGLALMSFYFLGFIITIIFSPLETLIHNYGVFFMFATLSLLSTLIVPLLMPETKGKSLEEIELFFTS